MSHFDTSSWRKCRVTRHAVSHHYSAPSAEAKLDASGTILTEGVEVLVEPNHEHNIFWATQEGASTFFLLFPYEFEEVQDDQAV